MTTSRRTWLAWTLGASVWPRFLQAAPSGRRRRLSCDFRPDAEAAAALLPPGLQPVDEPRLRLELETVEPADKDLLEPESWGWARLLAAARSGEREGWVPVRVYVSNERRLRVARERFGLPAVWAEVELAVDGARVSGSIALGGRTLCGLTLGRDGATAAGAPDAAPSLVWTGAPASGWRRQGGRLAGARVAALAAEDPADAEREACRFVGVESSWALGAGIGGWYGEGAGSTPPSPGKPEELRQVSAAEAHGWSPLSYPPDAAGDPLKPLRLDEPARRALTAKKEIALRSMEAIELDLMISTETHEAMLPPMFRSGGRPMLKVLGLRVHESDLSPEPFQEAWLFAFAIAGGRAGWYAVSHIAEPQGDISYGREAFGYPSKLGVPDVVATPMELSLTIQRLRREVFHAEGMFTGFATGTSLGQLPVLTLRAGPGGESAEVLYQMWTFQGRRSRVDPATLRIAASDGAVEGLALKSDPWYELNPLRPISGSAMDGGKMQRNPAESLLVWPDFQQHYRERCDGVLPWEDRPATLRQPTFLTGGATGSRT